MAKAALKTKKTERGKLGGPFIAGAFFCESIIPDGRDGALSAIRIIDTVNLTLPPILESGGATSDGGMSINVTGAVLIKNGDAVGKHDLRLESVSPSGKTRTVHEQVVTLGPLLHGGFNLIVSGTFEVASGGLFWMHVYLDGVRMTSMPLMINVKREEHSATPDAPDAEMARVELSKERVRKGNRRLLKSQHT